jgi:hypothetical protein
MIQFSICAKITGAALAGSAGGFPNHMAIIRSNGVPHKTPAKAAGVEFDQCGERPPTWCALQFAW